MPADAVINEFKHRKQPLSSLVDRLPVIRAPIKVSKFVCRPSDLLLSTPNSCESPPDTSAVLFMHYRTDNDNDSHKPTSSDIVLCAFA